MPSASRSSTRASNRRPGPPWLLETRRTSRRKSPAASGRCVGHSGCPTRRRTGSVPAERLLTRVCARALVCRSSARSASWTTPLLRSAASTPRRSSCRRSRSAARTVRAPAAACPSARVPRPPGCSVAAHPARRSCADIYVTIVSSAHMVAHPGRYVAIVSTTVGPPRPPLHGRCMSQRRPTSHPLPALTTPHPPIPSGHSVFLSPLFVFALSRMRQVETADPRSEVAPGVRLLGSVLQRCVSFACSGRSPGALLCLSDVAGVRAAGSTTSATSSCPSATAWMTAASSRRRTTRRGMCRAPIPAEQSSARTNARTALTRRLLR